MLYTWLICIVLLLLFFSGVLQGFADVYMFVGEPQGRKEPSKGLGLYRDSWYKGCFFCVLLPRFRQG